MFAIIRLEGVEHPLLWIVLTLAGVGVLFAAYRGIFQRSERRLTWLLMLLRGGGLIALLLALAKPTWTRETEVVDAGHVAVVLDNSLSMSLSHAGGGSRYASARQAIERLDQALAGDRASPRLQIDLFDITGAPLPSVPEQPAVERTDLARAVLETTARLRSKPLVAVVLVSDGMDNTGRQDFRELEALPVPVHTVGFPPDTAADSLDLAIKSVQAPERAMVHNEIKVECLVTKSGGPATNATVLIKRGRETLASQNVAFAAGDGEQKISVPFTPAQPGSFVFTAAVESEAGDRAPANNSRHFPLRVDAEPIRVLYLEGFLRYEFKFLKDRLEDDPDIGLVSLVRRAHPEQADARPSQEFLTPDRLKHFHVVILGDMEANYLTQPEYQALVRWLDEKGHALLVIGGYHSFGPDGFRSTPLADVLPVIFAEKPPYQSEEAFTLKLTEEGRRHPIFELSKDRLKDAATWSTAPQLLGASLVQRAKPAAEVLAVNESLSIDGKPSVVAAVQRYGAGQTMIFTADTSWRWSRLPRVAGVSDTLYARFWSQTIRWLSGRGKDEERPLLALSTDRPAYDVGKPVTIRAVRQPRPDADLSSAEVGAEVTSPSGKPVPVPLRSSSAEPEVFTGTFYPTSGGRYELTGHLADKQGKPLANQAAEFLVHGSDLELADTGTNPANLKAIANLTGGVYADAADAAKLADKIARKERRTARIERSEFWNSPGLFVFFLAAVTGEWLIRRRNHLV